MKRNISAVLDRWVDSPVRQPLLLRGARQVGKTFSLKELGKRRFTHLLYINLEERPELCKLFDTFDPRTISEQASLVTATPVVPGKTLFFLDEIQECPRAIMALRYFQEKMPGLHVVGAGSLLESSLRSEDFRMPVGRVQSLWMFPMTFGEFLTATGSDALRDHLHHLSLGSPLSDILHGELEKKLATFLHVGGMPRIVEAYQAGVSLLDLQSLQTALLQTFRQDFGKYASRSQHKYLNEVFATAPAMVGKRYKYAHVNPDIPSRELKQALALLEAAQCVTVIRHSSAQGVPLEAGANPKKMKLLFLDIGLMQRALGREFLPSVSVPHWALSNTGALTEQLVGQELLAHGSPQNEPKLYFWSREQRNSSAEVDYLLQKEDVIFPVEVKSGKTGALRSLAQFLHEHAQSPFGLRFSAQALSFHDRILSLPLFMIEEWPRLVEEAAQRL